MDPLHRPKGMDGWRSNGLGPDELRDSSHLEFVWQGWLEITRVISYRGISVLFLGLWQMQMQQYNSFIINLIVLN